MHPVLFRILGKEIYSYGAMAALGLLAAILTWQWLDRREDRPPGFAADLGFWLMVSGIVGSRVTYVMANWSYYRSAPLEIIRIDQGGLIFYGGLILGRPPWRCGRGIIACLCGTQRISPFRGWPSGTRSDVSVAS